MRHTKCTHKDLFVNEDWTGTILDVIVRWYCNSGCSLWHTGAFSFSAKLKQPKQKGIKDFLSNKSIEQKENTACELIRSVKIETLEREKKKTYHKLESML